MQVRLKDIARDLGLSIVTISKVLRNTGISVRKRVRECSNVLRGAQLSPQSGRSRPDYRAKLHFWPDRT